MKVDEIDESKLRTVNKTDFSESDSDWKNTKNAIKRTVYTKKAKVCKRKVKVTYLAEKMKKKNEPTAFAECIDHQLRFFLDRERRFVKLKLQKFLFKCQFLEHHSWKENTDWIMPLP